MTEGTKTGSLAAVVGIVALLAWVTSSGKGVNSPIGEMVNKPLFAKFTDPITAASLKILRYDPQKVDYLDFEVARDRKSGVWTIPSHESYPADAGKQMSDAANLFVGLKVLGIATQKPAEQVLFGVVEPSKQNADKGGEGVGMLVQMRDEKGDMLADIIIGKELDKKQRYVRVPKEDVVYVVELDTTALSTDFKQWIEPDLLKLSSNDIETLGIRDYQIIQVQQGLALDKKYEADLMFSTAGGQWQATRITSFESDPPSERALTPEEQVNATKLNEIKNTLDNLKIADVLKKPAGLAADLKGDSNLLKNTESLTSLQRRGFYQDPGQKSGDSIDFLAKSGELVVTLKDGVQYVLRFGNSAGAEINAVDTADANDAAKAEDTVSFNRFMLVTARVDESKFPMPELERLPETVEELKQIEKMKQRPVDLPMIEPVTDAKPIELIPTDKPAEVEGDKPATDKPATDKPADPAVQAEPVVPAVAAPEKPASASVLGSVPVGRMVAFQEPQDDVKKADAPAKLEVPAPNAEPTEVEWTERLEAARAKITKENKRKIDDRDEKLKKAKNKVAELNGRFADWYYVISESEYKKLRISLVELVQPKSAGGAGAPGGFPGQGAFPGQGSFPGFQP